MFIAHPEDPGVAAALRAHTAAVLALNVHVADCRTCQEHSPLRYTICEDGHGLAAGITAAKFAVQGADAAASGPGPGRGGRRP